MNRNEFEAFLELAERRRRRRLEHPVETQRIEDELFRPPMMAVPTEAESALLARVIAAARASRS